MCFDHNSRPPIAPIEGGAIDAAEVALEAGDGNRFAAYVARAAEPAGTRDPARTAERARTGEPTGTGEPARTGIVILPDVRGLHAYYRDLALRFAERGIDAVGIDYFGRTAGIGDRGPGFDWAPHVPQTSYEGLRADVTAAVDHLRSVAGSERVFTIGFCMGGRLAFLSAGFELDLDGVIGFYGWPAGPSKNGTPAPTDVASTFEAPVLGIFGGADQGIGAEAVSAFEAALGAAGISHRVITYAGAPHSFFDRTREEHAEASAAAWDEVLAFVVGKAEA